MNNMMNSPRVIELVGAVKMLRKSFFLFIFFLVCVRGAECLIQWNSVGEFLLSFSVAVTAMTAILACFYEGKNSGYHKSH